MKTTFFLLLHFTWLLSGIRLSAQSLDASKYQWQNVAIGGGGYVTGVIFSESQRNLIYARTDVGGAYRWDSVANKWIQLLNFIGYGETFLRDVESMATDPIDLQRLYIAAGESSYTRILSSTDQGRTFSNFTPPFTVSGNGEGRGKGERLMMTLTNTDMMHSLQVTKALSEEYTLAPIAWVLHMDKCKTAMVFGVVIPTL